MTRLSQGFDRFKSLNLRAKLLGTVWLLFLVLVALGIHGSSTGLASGWWARERPYSGYLFSLPPQTIESLTKIDPVGLQIYLMGHARMDRWDEVVVATPYALAQLAHNPRFPVVNTNIGNGQNMLIQPHAPVFHIVTVSRPATWGYFLFGAQRGLAWYWWFQVFACFTVLYLLFEIALQGQSGLAAFGAFWFSASAYVVCWSQWPAHFVFFGGLCCLAAYQLLTAEKRRTKYISALLLGLSLPGFVMIMYPPWQVAAGYFFALFFVVLFIRDKVHVSLRTQFKQRLGLLALALILAGGLIASWLMACLPDLAIMSNTVYPGRRVSTGGDYSFGLLFQGFYNLITIYETPLYLRNQSESASFFFFYPTVFFAAMISRRLRRGLGLLGWSMIAAIVVMVLFVLVGVPEAIARMTLLSYIPSYRADLTVGLASIVLCLMTLKIMSRSDDGPESESGLIPTRAAVFTFLFLFVHSLFLMRMSPGFPPPPFALLMSLFGGLIGYCLIAGKARTFLAIAGSVIIATTALFNPLATNLDHIYDSELARAINEVNKQAGDRPFWVSYGGVHPGVLIEMLGGRSLSGVQWPPQLEIWRTLDSDGTNENIYNMYAEVSFETAPDDTSVTFVRPREGILRVQISPNNPLLRTVGARYVLLMGEAQQAVDTSKLMPVYRSSIDAFSMFEIPPDGDVGAKVIR